MSGSRGVFVSGGGDRLSIDHPCGGYSRKVLAWRLSNTMDTGFCLECLEAALQHGRPVIFNTDQGSQFTSRDYTQRLLDAGIRISIPEGAQVDGRGRALDNVFVERLWRSVKYENITIKGYETMTEAQAGLTDYFQFYNERRLHQSLDYATPNEVHGAVAADAWPTVDKA